MAGRCRTGNGLGVAVDLSDAGVVMMVANVVVITVAVLNILGGKLLVSAVAATWGIPTINIHLQQDSEIEADLQRTADPKLRRRVP